jgi:membrane-bound lytic murein transglycosylase B
MPLKRVIDVKREHSQRLNLDSRRIFIVPTAKIFIGAALALASIYFLLGSAAAPIKTSETFAQTSQEEREKLEKELLELENQMAQYETAVQDYKKQGKTLQSEIDQLNAKISKINLQIKAINLNLAKLDREISENKTEIRTTEQKIEFNRAAIARSLRILYEKDRLGLMAVLLKNPQLSDFFGDINNLIMIQNSLSAAVAKIVQLRNELIDRTEALALKREDAAELKAYQDAQKKSLNDFKNEKNNLLKTTKGQESKFQALLKETRKTAAQIRSRIFEFLGGGEMSFEEAYQFAKFADQATGVRAALILAVLDRESALGQNVGRCSYKTAMHPTRDVPIFLALVPSLGINPDTITVSCPNRDGLYGGAMGPAQFIPSTWNLYAEKVSEITGSSPPSPWRNGDAFVATALYLKDSLKGCDAIYSRRLDMERCAAAKYYAGARWRRHLWGYGDRVVTKAQQFQNDIDLLNN